MDWKEAILAKGGGIVETKKEEERNGLRKNKHCGNGKPDFIACIKACEEEERAKAAVKKKSQ